MRYRTTAELGKGRDRAAPVPVFAPDLGGGWDHSVAGSLASYRAGAAERAPNYGDFGLYSTSRNHNPAQHFERIKYFA